MMVYPVSVPHVNYRGSDTKKRNKNLDYNRIASKVEDYLNSELNRRPDDSVNVYMSYSVASAIGENDEIVRRIISSIDGGSNGVTIVKGNFERAMMTAN
jgi:hypothetical protein